MAAVPTPLWRAAAMFLGRRCWPLVLALVLVPASISLSAAAEPPSPQYLLFQIFLGGPDPRTGVFHRGTSKNDMLRVVRQIADTVPPRRRDPGRMLGFAIGPIAMDEGEDEARSVIREA